MNKLSALALGTALALSMPLAAAAQDTDLGVELDGGVGVELGGEDTGVDAGVDAALDAQTDTTVDATTGVDATVGADAELSAYTYGDLDQALQGAAAADLSAVNSETDIEIVTLSSLSDDGEFTADAFAEARGDHTADIGVLQSAVEDNADIVAELDAAGYTSEDVVAVWTQADGTLTIFVDDADASLDGAASTDLGVETDTTTDLDGETDTSLDVETDAEVEGEVEGEVTTQ